jgi:hypothetical protein
MLLLKRNIYSGCLPLFFPQTIIRLMITVNVPFPIDMQDNESNFFTVGSHTDEPPSGIFESANDAGTSQLPIPLSMERYGGVTDQYVQQLSLAQNKRATTEVDQTIE